MKKPILFLVIGFLILSCNDTPISENLTREIKKLKKENDSLLTIVDGINDKYVFDSVTIRNIPHYKNTNKINSLYKAEIVFVAYNANGQSMVILEDSIINNKGIKVVKMDTLIGKKGGFWLERVLNAEKNYFKGTLKTENKYGKSYEVPFGTGVRVN